VSFDAVGVPGFQFIQDPLDYMSRTHHSNMDVYDKVPKADMVQASLVVASCARCQPQRFTAAQTHAEREKREQRK
jgi:hypothetical protein